MLNRSAPLLLLAMLLCAGVVALSLLLAREAREISRMETDRAELHDISHGALDPDQWVARLSPIIAQRIERFEISEENRPHIKTLLVRVIDRLIDELPGLLIQMKQDDSFVARLMGSTSDRAFRLMLEASGIKDRSPELADSLIDELQKPETKKELVLVMHGALTELAAENLPPPDRASLKAVHQRHDCGSAPACAQKIDAILTGKQERALIWLGGMAGLAVLLLLVSARSFPKAPRLTAPILTVAAAGLLAAGLLAPMIQIDARISSLEFDLLGDTIRFDDQVLYFQSKSILDVVEILVRGAQPDLLLVGGLIALFSIGFPALKLVSNCLIVWRGRQAEPGLLLRFFTFHSSKWAMADVFVVAMFMAYIGMRGIVGDQLGQLEGGSSVSVLTTNGTALEPGFWAFLLFALFGIVMAIQTQRWQSASTEKVPAETPSGG